MTHKYRHFIWFTLFFLLLLSACGGSSDEAVEDSTNAGSSSSDEATDSETVVEESETIEVTRVVTETIIETVEVEAEAEPADGDSPSATGSEGDAGPLPPPPNDEPKVREGRGPSQTAERILETAVTLRATQPHTDNNDQPVAPNNLPAISPEEQRKWCQWIRKQNKKQCLLR